MNILCEHRASPPSSTSWASTTGRSGRKEVSEFPWKYDREETYYILRGKFSVTPDDGGEPQEFGRGDLDHLSCRTLVCLEDNQGG